MARTPDSSEAEFVRRVREPRAASTEPGRHRARRSAMMLLYRNDLVGGEAQAAIDAFEGEHGFAMPTYGAQLVVGVAGDRDAIDAQISAHLKEWRIDRLGAVERAVLRIAMHELLTGDVPAPVVIDEAVELSRRYSSPDAGKLVNGVLAGWLRASAADSERVAEAEDDASSEEE